MDTRTHKVYRENYGLTGDVVVRQDATLEYDRSRTVTGLTVTSTLYSGDTVAGTATESWDASQVEGSFDTRDARELARTLRDQGYIR